MRRTLALHLALSALLFGVCSRASAGEAPSGETVAGPGPVIELTAKEQAWVREHPVIRLGVDPGFAPFEYVTEDGAYEGMASDYVRLLNERLGLNMVVAHRGPWSGAVELAKSREVDVLPCVGVTGERERYFLFSEPYLTFFRVVVTRADEPFVGGVEDLEGLRIAVQSDSSHHGFLREQTELVPSLFDTAQDALVAVARGEADAAVGNAAVAVYWIRRLGLANLKIAAPAGRETNALCFAVRRDWPELVSIINRGLDSVNEEEAQAIRNKWVDVPVDPGYGARRLVKAVGGAAAAAAVALALLGLHNRRLRKEITTRQRTQEALRESEENYRNLVEGANSIILRMSPEGTVVFFNAFAERFFGYTAEDIIGKNVIGTIVPATEAGGRNLQEMILDIARHPGRYESNENENVTKSGQRVWVAWSNRLIYDSGGRVTEVLCVGNDVTGRKQAEAMLYRYEFIANTVGDMMSVINSQGLYEAVNDAWCSATGKSRAETIGRPVACAWTEETAEQSVWPRLQESFAGSTVAFEAVLDLPARGRRHCEVTMYPYASGSDGVTHVVVVTHDVTANKEAEAALKEAKQAAEAANRAKSTFLANMSHEIRTPMNAILGYTQILQRSPDLSTEQRRALEAVGRSGEHLLSLINDVLEMSKIEAGRIEIIPHTFDLRALVSDIVTMFRVKTDPKGLRLEAAAGQDVPRLVRADGNRVRQVLINLIGNAVKFTERGGITVRVDGQVRGGNALAPTETEPPFNGAPGSAPAHEDPPATITIEVEDTGCGIAPEDRERVFESFEQVNSGPVERGGTGLGLAISRNFARLMGGDIRVTGIVGRGSCFHFTFEAEPGDPAELSPAAPRRNVLRIREDQPEVRALVVDDRETNRDVLCRMLRNVGFVARDADNGRDALNMLQRWQPRVVLIDLVMPGMDGREAIRLMRATPEGKAAAIIAVTASALEDERPMVLAQGADAFLRKPFRESELYESIERHAGVRYVYEEEDSRDAPETKAAALASWGPSALVGVPRELARRLEEATITGSVDEIVEIAEEVRRYAPALAGAIRREAEDFSLDNLRALFAEEEQ